MQKRTKKLALAIGIMLGCASVRAQGIEARSEMLKIGANAVFPVSNPLNKEADPGVSVGVEYIYFRSPRIGLGFEVGTLQLDRGIGVEVTSIPGRKDYKELDATIVQATLRFNLVERSSVVPYVLGGLGFSRLSQTTIVSISGIDQEFHANSMDLIYTGAFGVDVLIGKSFVVGGKTSVQRLMTDYDDFDSNGLTLAGVGLQVGWLF